MSGLGIRAGMMRVAAAGGAVYGWETPIQVSTVGDSIISTEGSLVSAYNVGSASNQTVNGVTFAGTPTIGGLTANYSHAYLYQGGNVGASFESALDSFAFHSAGQSTSVTLSGLVSGRDYLLQVIISDERGGIGVNRTVTLAANGESISGYAQDPARSYIYRVTASGSTLTLTLSLNTGAPLCNLLQIREI